MATRASRRGTIVVAGDVTTDWHLARVRREGGRAVWTAGSRMCASERPGGAALLAALIREVANTLPARAGRVYHLPPLPPPANDSFAVWEPFKKGEKAPDDKQFVWRVEEFLGVDRHPPEEPRQPAHGGRADIVVIDDAGLGFGERDGGGPAFPAHWPRALERKGRALPRWVVLKMSTPVARSELWGHLLAQFADRLIVLMTVNDLRQMQVQISRELSWERTAQDLVWALVYNPSVNALARCAHVVVSFGAAGVLLLSGGAGPRPAARLFFDPELAEGAAADSRAGGMIGYTSCLTASVVRRVMLRPADPDIAQGVQSGLAAMRQLYAQGYGPHTPGGEPGRIALPVEDVVAEMAGAGDRFASADVPVPVPFRLPALKDKRRPDSWTILRDKHGRDSVEALVGLAREIVTRGAAAAFKAEGRVPLGLFGDLLTVDRREIEGYRSIRSLVGEYCGQERPKRPLSIAVFGPPGSGKSFGITEVAKSVLPGRVNDITFNLSQLKDPSELLGALHQVRDESLRGRIPLVFWDEFDTTLDGHELGWLRYFLAPMQDGKFQSGQITHPIGRAVFVFAGGTSSRLEEFGLNLGLSEEARKAAKLPDFVSRLKGYVNILGPNQHPAAADLPDDFFVVRRAILLRSMLLRDAPHLFDRPGKDGGLEIDPGVLDAFLRIPKYRHGARSMESIIAMSLLGGKSRYERSSLPSEAQLELHVNGRTFLALANQLDPDESTRRRLAVLVHESYRAGCMMVLARSDSPLYEFSGEVVEELAEMEHERWMREQIVAGYRYSQYPAPDSKTEHADLLPWGPLTDEERAERYMRKENEAIGHGVLSESAKEKDRDQIRALPSVLAAAGYTIVDVADKDVPDEEDGAGGGDGRGVLAAVGYAVLKVRRGDAAGEGEGGARVVGAEDGEEGA